MSETQGNTTGYGNTSSPKKTRNWCFTVNNYDSYYKNFLMTDTQTQYFVLGYEGGDMFVETPHIQGYLEFKNGKTFKQAKAWFGDKAHIEERIGTRQQAIDYCKKGGVYDCIFKCCIKTNHRKKMLKKYAGVQWKPWQSDIINIVESEPDDRTIHWVYERNGNIGKSFLAKYLFLKYNAIIGEGKKADVFNQILVWLDEFPNNDIKLVILDVPRYNKEYLNYGTIESIKNGMLYSGKYEGGTAVFNPPHLIIFANEEPDYTKLSADRWNIVCLDDSLENLNEMVL